MVILDGDKIRVSFNDIVVDESTLDGAYKGLRYN
jgi:hypothetical protein